MKQNKGELSEAELKARRRFWNKRGFFGEPTKKQLERDSMKMQKLVKALRTFSPLEEVEEIRAKRWPGKYFTKDMYTVWRASESDFNHAISTFKIFLDHETVYSLHILGDHVCIIHFVVLRADN